MTDKELLEKKKVGDIPEVAKMLGVSKGNADVILRRPKAKRHNEAMRALALIIEAREAAHKKATSDHEEITE